ncbi:MAG: phosphatase PAP2 family protein [Lachnospiraceae bacterium]|nr:phosphatase PAP2 family protein [Lachnospiraceae bacterium]
MANSFFFNWEISFMEWLQAVLPHAVIQVISLISFFGEELFLVLMLGFIYWCWDKEIGKKVGFAVVMSNIWNPMIKNVFLRRRPYFESEQIDLLRPIADGDIYDLKLQGYSFPSGHSTNAAALFGIMAMSFKKKIFTVLAVVVPLLVAFSRMVVGAHFPTDVLVGLALGYLIMLVVTLLYDRLNRYAFYAVMLVTSLPGLLYCRSEDYYTGLGLLIGLIAAFTFEEKKVGFEVTRQPLRMIARVVCGGALFFGLNTLLKLPFPGEFLGSGSFAALMVRCCRYAVVSFITIGVYPMLFKVTAKIGRKAE